MFRHGRSALRQDTLERRLFQRLLATLLVPAFALIIAALIIGSQSVQFVGTLGAWDEVAESGRALLDAASASSRNDPAVARALERHQRNLSASLVQARRWGYVGARIAAALPLLALSLMVALTVAALLISRRIARDLARPIAELVGWTELLAAGDPLPVTQGDGGAEVSEVRALRSALQHAASQIESARRRDLEMERVRAWGEMARRVAHEMKNPLTPMRLALHALQRSPHAPQSEEPIEVIGQETARLEELAQQFSLLGRPSAGHESDVDVRELVDTLLRTDVPATIAVSLEDGGGNTVVHGHFDALQRAVRNMLRNAVEAIDSHGNDREIAVRLGSDETSVHVEIEDTGGGIPDDRVERIFDPDFTLKAGGTGLGLAIVRQAIASHGGVVTARNGARGAIFEARIPRAS